MMTNLSQHSASQLKVYHKRPRPENEGRVTSNGKQVQHQEPQYGRINKIKNNDRLFILSLADLASSTVNPHNVHHLRQPQLHPRKIRRGQFSPDAFPPGKVTDTVPSVPKWIAAYKDLEDYVIDNERTTTLTYYFGVPEEVGSKMSASTQMLAFEAYNVRADLYETHFHSQPMDVFLKKIPPTMTTGLDITHFEDVAGYLDKADMKECGIFYDTRIKAADGKREEVLARLGKLAKWVEENEKETFTYLVLKSLDDEDGVHVFERYASRKALEAHQSGKEYIELLMGSKEIIKSMEGRGYIPNGHGWLHR